MRSSCVCVQCGRGILGLCLLVGARGCHVTGGGRVPGHVSPLTPSRSKVTPCQLMRQTTPVELCGLQGRCGVGVFVSRYWRIMLKICPIMLCRQC